MPATKQPPSPRVGTSIQLPLALRDAIDAIAHERHTTRTAVIEQILTTALHGPTTEELEQ